MCPDPLDIVYLDMAREARERLRLADDEIELQEFRARREREGSRVLRKGAGAGRRGGRDRGSSLGSGPLPEPPREAA